MRGDESPKIKGGLRGGEARKREERRGESKKKRKRRGEKANEEEIPPLSLPTKRIKGVKEKII